MSTAAADPGAALHPPPRLGAVAWQQLRSVGLSLRRELVVGGVILVSLSLPLLVHSARNRAIPVNLQFAEMMMLPFLLGVFASAGVWKGEEPARRAYLWSQPVDRSRHALTKVLGGWAWLMAAVAGYVLWIALVSRLAGGEVSLGSTHVPWHPLGDATPTAADFVVHAWPVPPWLWVVPFALATAMYLLGTTVVLSTNHPWRWIAGLWLGCLLVGVLAEAGVGWCEWLLHSVVEGRYGLKTLGTGSRSGIVALAAPDGGQVRTTVHLPVMGLWAATAALWIGIGMAGVLAAAHRYQEG